MTLLARNQRILGLGSVALFAVGWLLLAVSSSAVAGDERSGRPTGKLVAQNDEDNKPAPPRRPDGDGPPPRGEEGADRGPGRGPGGRGGPPGGDAMHEVLQELRALREEVAQLRQEVRALRGERGPGGPDNRMGAGRAGNRRGGPDDRGGPPPRGQGGPGGRGPRDDVGPGQGERRGPPPDGAKGSGNSVRPQRPASDDKPADKPPVDSGF